MSIKKHLVVKSAVLRDRVNKYAFLGLAISFVSILIASILVSYQLTGFIDIPGFILAQKTNPALWALDMTPMIFAYWGQSFCYELASTMETLIENKTRILQDKSNDLELKLHYETNHDHLTKLPNQRLLSERINQGIKQLRTGEELALILIHIRSFKEMNYTYGSFNANHILVQFAEKLKTILLEPYLLQAFMGMNMVARLQGAEFAILLPRLVKEHQLEQLITKLLDSTQMNLMIDGQSVKVSTTAGIAIYPTHGRDDAALMLHANSSLFYAEKQGIPYAIYDSNIKKGISDVKIKSSELVNALEKDQLTIMYVPDMNLKTDAIIGVEAQVYFEDPEYGMTNVDKLLPSIENTALLKKITTMTLNQALKQWAVWFESNKKMVLTINLLDVTDLEFPNLISKLLKKYNISPEYLKVQLTEKVCLSDQSVSIQMLKKLANMGVKLAISDFCSGYSSFTYLTTFPIHEIKIDKSYIRNMLTNENQLRVVSASMKLAEALGLVAFADGIPDLKTLKKLKQLGCMVGQGPYFSSPLPGDEMTSMLGQTK